VRHERRDVADDRRAGAWSFGYALDCTATYSPAEPRGLLEMTYLLSFDLAAGIAEWGSAGLLAEGQHVYATADSLYLAAPDYARQQSRIHRFNISDPLEPVYFGSGAVPGYLLSQWSLDEHEGYLRAASTLRDRWPSVSQVTILEAVPGAADGALGSLQAVAAVGGLGATEEIFAARFMGAVGSVVTFRQTDPLYVLDLSDPRAPKSAGELKIPGFSRYLHPLGGGLLLGLGRDADPQTGAQGNLQASLFDVSNPSEPRRISVLDLGNAFSPAESDHRAFRYHDGVAYIPTAPYSWQRGWRDLDGAFQAVRVAGRSLEQAASLPVSGEALRALPLGAQLHLLSGKEIRSFTLNGYAELGAAPFGD